MTVFSFQWCVSYIIFFRWVSFFFAKNCVSSLFSTYHLFTCEKLARWQSYTIFFNVSLYILACFFSPNTWNFKKIKKKQKTYDLLQENFVTQNTIVNRCSPCLPYLFLYANVILEQSSDIYFLKHIMAVSKILFLSVDTTERS